MPAAGNDTRSVYVPCHGSAWEHVQPTAAGFDPRKLEAAVALAVARESSWPRTFYYPDGRYVGIVEWNESGPVRSSVPCFHARIRSASFSRAAAL
jgi:hypothetical protein